MKESTRRVLRTALQVLAGLAVLAPILVREAGLDPAELPWLATALLAAAAVTRIMSLPEVDAILQRLGIGLQQDGRHELGRTEDRGAAGVRVGLVLALVAVVMLAMPAAAAPRRHLVVRPGPLFVGITSARTCMGLLELRYSTERLGRGAWEVVPDGWGADVQLHRIGTAAGPGGRWEPAPEPTRRGEGYVGVPASSLPTWDLARVVVRADSVVVASSGRIPEGCSA